jgi:hypothetical protein
MQSGSGTVEINANDSKHAITRFHPQDFVQRNHCFDVFDLHEDHRKSDACESENG